MASEEIAPEVQTLAKRKDSGESMASLLQDPHVVRMMVEGYSARTIADYVGCNPETVRRYKRSLPMQDLLEIESHRILRHMGRRDLSKERYQALATSAAIIIDKMRLLKDEPTSISETRGGVQAFIANINIALHGVAGGGSGEGSINGVSVQELEPGEATELPALPEPGAVDGVPEADLGGDLEDL